MTCAFSGAQGETVSAIRRDGRRALPKELQDEQCNSRASGLSRGDGGSKNWDECRGGADSRWVALNTRSQGEFRFCLPLPKSTPRLPITADVTNAPFSGKIRTR